MLAGANSLVLNKYKLGARLAVGGMGEVHLAQTTEGKTVVLKALLPHLAADQQMVAQFIDEAKLASKLKHPNLVHVHEYGQWKDTWVLAMEHIDGPDLGQVLKRCAKQGLTIPWQVAVAAISDAALGLSYAHELADARGTKLNLIHRDVSPQNILVGRDGRARVLDFGIAASVDKTTRTATGILKGKLAYMAPEQAKSEPLTAAVDQFALGLVLWELLTARRAFVGPNDVSLLKLAIEGVVPPPSTVNATVPAPVEAVVMRMLKPQVADRYASCRDAQLALRALIPGDPQEVLRTFVAKVPREDVVESMQTRSTPRPGAGATPPRGNETAELTPRTPKTPHKPPTPAANLPLLNAFLARLPQGLESFPEVQQKGSILPSFLDGVPIQQHLAVLPGPLAEMIKRPPLPTAWISEVKVAAICMACADLCFPSADAYVQFANRANRKIMDGPIYSMLFRVLGVKRIVRQVSGRWEQFHRGTTLTLLNFEGNEGRLKLVAPAFSTPLLFAQCHGQAIHVGVEIAGGKNVSVTCTETTPGTFDYVCRWSE